MTNMNAYFPEHCAGGISFDIPDHWFEAVHKAMKEIVQVDPDVKFFQVKAKFGRLRIYYETQTREPRALIDDIIKQCEDTLAEGEI